MRIKEESSEIDICGGIVDELLVSPVHNRDHFLGQLPIDIVIVRE